MIVILLALSGGYAFGHTTQHPQRGDYTTAEIEWMKKQRAVDGTFCCGPENILMVEDPLYRVRGQGDERRYEVYLLGRWLPVPPGRMFRHNPDDPPPFDGVFVFFATSANSNVVTIFCFRIPPRG
jgi:hypothetical protein